MEGLLARGMLMLRLYPIIQINAKRALDKSKTQTATAQQSVPNCFNCNNNLSLVNISCAWLKKIRATSYDTAHIKTSLFFSCAVSIQLFASNVKVLQ